MTALIFICYLLMLLQQPYTNLHIDFNGGYFDDPNRIFFSIDEAWNNCLESTSDVRVSNIIINT